MKTMRIIKDIALGACVGIAIGTSIELVSSSFSGSLYSPGVPSFLEQFSNMHTGVLIERIVYALYGVVCTFAGRIYENETRSLILSSAMHLAIVVSCGLGAGVYLRWWSSASEFAGVLAMILVVYFVIWAVVYLLARSNVNKLNEQIQARNGE